MNVVILGPAPSASVYVALQLCISRNNPRDVGIHALMLSAARPFQWNSRDGYASEECAPAN
jgi:hypothetical protein